ncbi:hypothetical protein PMSD_20665 [Paenibacillus macquariensis subsp. defensor]|nr:hypothetical protein PMSD_20665 [Paenibacillus macquariensis subsp. defensor]
MKRYVSGLVSGLLVGLLIFGSIPALADSLSLVGSKVTGVFTIKQNGKVIAESAIINGSAYVPVRIMAEATGTALSVEGKVITLGEAAVTTNATADEMYFQKTGVLDRIKSAKAAITRYETDVIPRAEERLSQTKGTDEETQRQEWLDSINKDLERHKIDLADAQNKLAAIEAQIAALGK